MKIKTLAKNRQNGRANEPDFQMEYPKFEGDKCRNKTKSNPAPPNQYNNNNNNNNNNNSRIFDGSDFRTSNKTELKYGWFSKW